MEIFVQTNWHLICRHGRGILFQFLAFSMINDKLVVWSHNKQVLFPAFAGSPISIILSDEEFELNTVPGSCLGS